MPMQLSPIELRVLGVLIEKSMTNTDTYPLTLNALAVGCSQKSNRDPVINVSEGEAATAVHELLRWQLVSHADTNRGARSNRFQHETEKRFGWNAAQRAIMAELMLRGPQTLGELRTRAARMTHIGDLAFMAELMAELQRTDPPMVIELPRQPGRRETRWAHTLGDPIDAAEMVVRDQPPQGSLMPADASAHAALDARIDALSAEVAQLRSALLELKARVHPGNPPTTGEAGIPNP